MLEASQVSKLKSQLGRVAGYCSALAASSACLECFRHQVLVR